MSLYLIRAALWAVAIATLLVGAGIDLRKRVIPNRLVILVAASGLALSLVSRPERIWISLLVALLLLLILAAISHYGLIGGGDAKLISAVSLLVPPESIGSLLFAIALAGGVLSCCYLALYFLLKRRAHPRKARATVFRRTRWLAQLLRSERTRILSTRSIPYGVAVLGGVGIVITSEFIKCFSAISCSL